MSREEVVLALVGIVVIASALNSWFASRTMKRRALEDTVGDFMKLLGGGK